MKIGDKLYCTRSVVMESSKIIETTVGKIYEVVKFDGNKLIIINDSKTEHCFDLRENIHSYWKNWFSVVRIDRMNKLKKLNGLHHS